MAAATLRLLGAPSITNANSTQQPLPAKAYILLAALELEYAGGAARDTLATLLWPEVASSKASANLRQLVAFIKRWQRDSQIELLGVEKRFLRLSPSAPVSDVGQLMRSATPVNAEQLTLFAEMRHGELLAGLDNWVEPELSRWLATTRERINRHFTGKIVSTASIMVSPELEWALEQCASLFPYDDALVRARMNTLAAMGKTGVASKAYEDFAAQLSADLGAKPELETTSLLHRIAKPMRTHEPRSTEAKGPAHTAASSVQSSVPKLIILPPAALANSDQISISLAQSLTADISLSLCRARTFSMFAPHTARQLLGMDPLAAVAPFNLDYVVTTSVFPGARFPRLAFSLIRTATSEILLSDEVALDPAMLMRGQAGTAAAIAASLTGRIGLAELRSFRATGAASAYVHFLLGQEHIQNNDLARIRRARRHIAQALKLAPGYVPAISALSRTLSIEWLLLGRPDKTLLHEAKKLAHRAVEIDPLEASGHRELGHSSMYLGELDESAEHFEVAHERAPNYADILADQADILVHNSRMSEAKRSIDQAIQLNPLAPDEYYWISGSAEFFLGNYRVALSTLQKMADQTMVDRLIAASAAMAGNLELAHRHRDRWLRKYPDFRLRDFEEFVPHKSKADADAYVYALSVAGFS